MKRLLSFYLIAGLILSGCSFNHSISSEQKLNNSKVVTPQNTLTAQQAYDYVQNIREQAHKNWAKGGANNQEIETGIQQLEEALTYLDQPIVNDLRFGSTWLRFRSFDVHRELGIAYALLGDEDAAISHFQSMYDIANTGYFTKKLPTYSELKKLIHNKQFLALIKRADTEYSNWVSTAIPSPYKQNLSDAEKIAGLSLFWSQAKYNFAYFDQVENLDWDQAYLDYIPKILTTKTTEEYYLELMTFAPLLKDSHTNIYPPKELQQRFYARPPFRTRLVENKVIVTEVWSDKLKQQGIARGVELLSINSIPVQQYAKEKIEPWVSASTLQDKQVRLYEYALLSGSSDENLKLEFLNKNSKKFTRTISRNGYEHLIYPKRFEFKMLPNKVAYLALDSFENNQGVKAFEQAWPQIQNANALILDVRRNGGGNTIYGFNILQHLTQKPFLGSRYKTRIYEPLRSQNNIEWFIREPDTIKPNLDMNFAKPVIVLTGPKTFSAAEDFVVAFKNMQRGNLIGETTAGSTGQPIVFDLPGGGKARICVKRDSFPNGKEFVGYGIEPDIKIEPKIKDIITGSDGVIKAALNYLYSHNEK